MYTLEICNINAQALYNNNFINIQLDNIPENTRFKSKGKRKSKGKGKGKRKSKSKEKGKRKNLIN